MLECGTGQDTLTGGNTTAFRVIHLLWSGTLEVMPLLWTPSLSPKMRKPAKGIAYSHVLQVIINPILGNVLPIHL